MFPFFTSRIHMPTTTGFVYCPPDYSQSHKIQEITKIAQSTQTDIYFIPSLNKIEIEGDSQEEVFKAQQELNQLFTPSIKAKKSWIRPDRPGEWGQRRDRQSS